MILLLLVFDLLSCANADTFSLVVPDGFISGQLGSSVILPCTVSPPLDCKTYEVRWYRSKDKNNPILLYKDLKVQENTGDPRYRNRVSLIGELGKGNVSLKLENFIQADKGEYVCYVESYKWYERASVFLNLPVVGSPPLLSLAEAGDKINVTCATGGWAPNTTLTWRDKEGRELRNSVDQYRTDSDRLVSVSSWLLVSPSESEWISCSVGLSDQEMKEGRVLPLKPATVPGYTAVIILFVISLLMLVGMTVFIFRGRIFPKRSQKESPSTEEEGVRLVGSVTGNKKRGPGTQACPATVHKDTTINPETTAGPATANKDTATNPGIPELRSESTESSDECPLTHFHLVHITASFLKTNRTNEYPLFWYVGVAKEDSFV
ncbi:hypothetical protein NFI96_027263 [Prochilodus magdalenae]|nr:hypothetical protein NFI96_027263 [Prochilodus magdalenae]